MRRAVVALLILLMLVSPALAATIVVPGLPPVVVPDPPYSGCVLHLTFDEGTGNVTYNAVNPLQYNGTLGDGINYMPTWVPGKLGYALEFDNDDYLTFPCPIDYVNTTEFSYGLWIRINNVDPDYNELIFDPGVIRLDINIERSGATGGIFVWYADSNGRGYLVYKDEQAKYSDGKWHFWFINKKSDRIEVWVDGQLIRDWKFATYGATNTVYANRDIGRIGVNAITNNNFDVDEVMIFNRALSDKEIQLLYQRGATHRFDTNITINLRQLNVPRVDLSGESATVEINFDISADATGTVWIPIPASAKILDNVEFAYGIDGKVVTIDDNRYVNASSVTVSVPISIDTATESELPNELYLDSDSKTFEFKKSVRIYNPSDISIMATLSIDPRSIGVAQAYLDGSPMSMFDGSLVSSIILNPGESKVMELTATLPITKQELEFRATLDDFFEIDSFDEAMTLAQSATEGKIETVTKVIAIDSADFKSFGNRTVIIPLDVDVDDVIEAKALTGSKELLEVREGKDGKAEIVVPATVFEGTPLNTQHAEIKVIYNKKPAWWERLPFLKSLGGIFEFLAKLFGFGR